MGRTLGPRSRRVERPPKQGREPVPSPAICVDIEVNAERRLVMDAQHTGRTVVVGVDGSDSALRAVR